MKINFELTGPEEFAELQRILFQFTRIDDQRLREMLQENMASIIKHKTETNISELNLTVRTAHCLLGAEILTVEDLVKHTDNQLLRIPNLGSKSLREIHEKLAERALALRG